MCVCVCESVCVCGINQSYLGTMPFLTCCFTNTTPFGQMLTSFSTNCIRRINTSPTHHVYFIHNPCNNNNKHFKRPLIHVTKARAATWIPYGLYISVSQNKNDFSICLKIPSVTAGSRSAAGRVFQDAGREVLKAHGPRVTVRVRGRSSWWLSDDRSRGRPSTVATRTQRRVR